MPEWVAPFVTVAGGIGAAYLTARFAFRATSNKTDADKELGAGALALDIAQRLDGEIKEVRTTLLAVRVAWRQHTKWDDAIVLELESLDPGASKRLPERPELPFD